MPYKYLRYLLILIFIVSYFLIIRPVRGAIYTSFFYPVVEQLAETNNDLQITNGNEVSTTLHWGGTTGKTELVVKIPFGLFFLIGFAGLIWLESAIKYYTAIVLVQIIGGALITISLFLGINFSDSYLVVSDLAISYLVPLCSLGIVILSFMERRENKRPIN